VSRFASRIAICNFMAKHRKFSEYEAFPTGRAILYAEL
jgi:hypothetical protein